MSVKIRYFASMRDRMGKAEDTVVLEGSAMTVANLWKKISGQPLPSNTLIAVNMEYKDGNAEVKNGDEVAFFPPVTGG
ncbi:MAG: molybdopterin synthase sulfur carrier subunit [Gammaproteobacteria bacterium]|nr:MAG: molybdopterin synthase sulfur carrier subunit [Gammaproteobacteria bacterium]TND06383.1 MAG: molybdopterin synthase sulfur carrier subunit [Gammaproteobacteria bacterium]